MSLTQFKRFSLCGAASLVAFVQIGSVKSQEPSPPVANADASAETSVGSDLAVPQADGVQAAPNEAGLPEQVVEDVVAKQAEDMSKFQFSGAVVTGIFYDDNLFYRQSVSGESNEDTVFKAGVVLNGGYGDPQSKRFLAAAYGLDYLWYADHSELNDFNHNAQLSYGFDFGALTGKLNAQFSRVNGGDRNVSTFTQRDTITAGGDAYYELGGKTRLIGGFTYSYMDYAGYLSSEDWRVRGGFDYEVTGKIRMGLTGEYGRLSQEGTDEIDYQRANVVMSYAATAKTSLAMSAGLDFRDQPNGDSEMRGVFDIAANYAYSEKTRFTLSAGRNFTGSPTSTSQSLDTTHVNLGVGHKLNDKLNLTAGLGYQWVTYEGAGAEREDEYLTGKVQLDYQFNNRFTVGAFYELSDNASTTEDVDFQSNRYGLLMMVTF